MKKIFLGFDYGTRCIGVAVGQLLTKTASPLPAIFVGNGSFVWLKINALVDEWRPSALIVGIPYNDGYPQQEIIRQCRQFSEELRTRFLLPVYEVDERLTTKEAKQLLKARLEPSQKITKGQIDSLAAALIVEQLLKTQ